MATVGDLLNVHHHVLQIIAADRSQPTVSEVAEQAGAGTLIPYLASLAAERDVDTSILTALYSPDSAAGLSVSESIASAANTIDTQRKYGMAYDAPVGLFALLWFITDQIPQEARAIDLGF